MEGGREVGTKRREREEGKELMKAFRFDLLNNEGGERDADDDEI